MANNIDEIRTLEDLTNVVSELYYNLNNIERLYFNMFVNPDPMTLTLERYDENGVLSTIQLNNRAKDLQNAYTGEGSPQNQKVAAVGSFYIDTVSKTLYYKSAGTGSSGWVELWSAQNFKENQQYLPVNGDGAQLTNLNAENISVGILPIANGGTGTSGLTGIIKGRGASTYAVAIDGSDFWSPNSLTMAGVICYYPSSTPPSGWLRCDGTSYPAINYPVLADILAPGQATFSVPNLVGASTTPTGMYAIIKY